MSTKYIIAAAVVAIIIIAALFAGSFGGKTAIQTYEANPAIVAANSGFKMIPTTGSGNILRFDRVDNVYGAQTNQISGIDTIEECADKCIELGVDKCKSFKHWDNTCAVSPESYYTTRLHPTMSATRGWHLKPGKT